MPDAIFEIGKEYLADENKTEAERQFRYLIEDYPNHHSVKFCHVGLGSIYYGDAKYPQAIEEYKTIAKNYPGTPEAQKAISDAEDAYKKQGDIKGYIDWVKTLPNTNISTSKEDSLYYDAAYRKYMLDEYNGASKDFETYLKNFSNGFEKHQWQC